MKKVTSFLLTEKFYLPIIYMIMASIIYGVIKGIIKRISNDKRINNKKKTILSLIKNIIKYIIYICTALGILGVYGIDTTGIVASIGIAGLVIGLALQDIISDFLAGILILFDNKYSLGDIVEINGFKGEVINFGLMSTKIKNGLGEIKILSNSSFKEVTNYSMANSLLVINLDVSYDTNIDLLDKVLNDLRSEVLKINNVEGNYSVLGINEFSSSSIKYTVSIECKPNTGYGVKREYFKLVKKAFDENHIEIPYDKLDVNLRGKHE